MITAKRSLGQNFLIDKNIIKKIVNLVNLKDRNVIEIGPGKGALTQEILKKKPKSFLVIEKDRKLFEFLSTKYSKVKRFKALNEDILNVEMEKIIDRKSIIFGNLPYNISSQILVKFIKFEKWPPFYLDLIFMFQKELAEKICGKFLTNNYSRLSILTNYRLKIKKKFHISSNCFSPKPRVTSTLLHFQPTRNDTFNIKNINNLEKITNILFSGKRKMINKNLKKILTDNEIKHIDELNLSARPSQLNPEIYYRITEFFEKKRLD